MIKTELLSKIDNCLRNYVDQHNTRYKRNINSFLMSKDQLKNFYYDMKQQKQDKLVVNSQKINKKSNSCYNKQQNISINWRSAQKIKMNTNPLISNLTEAKTYPNSRAEGHQTQVSTKEDPKLKMSKNNQIIRVDRKKEGRNSIAEWVKIPQQISNLHQKFVAELKLQREHKCTPTQNNYCSQIQHDQQEVEKFKRREQQKYVNKYLVRNKRLVRQQGKEKVEICIESLEADNKKLKLFFKRILQGIDQDKYNYGNKQVDQVRQQRNKRQIIQNTISSYFYRKNKYLPSC